jgi:hypothetical protein
MMYDAQIRASVAATMPEFVAVAKSRIHSSSRGAMTTIRTAET